jgi:hypothetical protein
VPIILTEPGDVVLTETEGAVLLETAWADDDPLRTKVHKAIAFAGGDLTPEVREVRVYRRDVAEFSPARDQLPALLAVATPGGQETRRKTLSKLEISYPFTLILVDAANQNPRPDDPAAAVPEWRAGWRDRVGKELHGTPTAASGFPDEVRRVTPDPNAFLDLAAFEAKNLWWSAVPLRVLCRTPI